MAEITALFLTPLAGSPERFRQACELEQTVHGHPSGGRSARLIAEVACEGVVESGISGTAILTCNRAIRGACPNAQITHHGDHTPPQGITLSLSNRSSDLRQ